MHCSGPTWTWKIKAAQRGVWFRGTRVVNYGLCKNIAAVVWQSTVSKSCSCWIFYGSKDFTLYGSKMQWQGILYKYFLLYIAENFYVNMIVQFSWWKVAGAVIISGSPGLIDEEARKVRRAKDDFSACFLASSGLESFLDAWYSGDLWNRYWWDSIGVGIYSYFVLHEIFFPYQLITICSDPAV